MHPRPFRPTGNNVVPLGSYSNYESDDDFKGSVSSGRYSTSRRGRTSTSGRRRVNRSRSNSVDSKSSGSISRSRSPSLHNRRSEMNKLNNDSAEEYSPSDVAATSAALPSPITYHMEVKHPSTEYVPISRSAITATTKRSGIEEMPKYSTKTPDEVPVEKTRSRNVRDDNFSSTNPTAEDSDSPKPVIDEFMPKSTESVNDETQDMASKESDTPALPYEESKDAMADLSPSQSIPLRSIPVVTRTRSGWNMEDLRSQLAEGVRVIKVSFPCPPKGL